MIDLLIDRVGNVNVFNILFDGETYAESHLQSVMDEDLIFEYIKEIENLSKVSQALHSNIGDTTRFRPDILKELKILGETFFLQFFPAQVAEKLRMTNQKYLHFNIDQGLSDIPWELLHNGECFLSDKFYIGKTVKGAYRSNSPIEKDKLRMLIIIDPTEDLEWAEKEGEELFKTLKSKISPSKLDISFIGGKQITKLKLLSLIKDKHIIHYSGHLYFSDEPLENGWLLSNGKVLKAREIKNCGFSTDLVFSNSCDSSKNVRYNNSHGIMNYFAGSFLMSGIKCFIGTNWEIIDNQKTLDFTIRFYLSLLNDRSIGESLFTAKEYARRNYESWDLTWANYSLHGPPSYIIINKPEKNIQKIINPNSIINFYPTPVARSYKEFLDLEMEESGHQKAMEAVINCFEDYSRLIGIIVFSNHRFQSLGNNNPFEFKLKTWWEQIYQCIWDFKKLEISMFMDSFMKILYSNRDVINKMVDWINKYRIGGIREEDIEGYMITYQYYFENLLIESDEFEANKIVLLSRDSNSHLFFSGIWPDYSTVHQPGDTYLEEQVEKYRGRIVLYSKEKKALLPLSGIKVTSIDKSKELRFDVQNALPDLTESKEAV